MFSTKYCYKATNLFTAIPEVKVTPRIQSRRPGKDASMFCHVIGEPFPKVRVEERKCNVF